MPTSPRTPRHSRGPSAVDISFTSPSPGSPNSHRRNSASLHSPITPRGSLIRSDSTGMEAFGSSGAQPSDGLGNLADELADAWDEDEEELEESDLNFHEPTRQEETGQKDIVDSGVDLTGSPTQYQLKDERSTLSPPKIRGHRRKSSDYDGSDYGEDSDIDSASIPPTLVARMDAVESLARRGMEENGTERDGVVRRVVQQLRELGGQSGVEGHSTRLITAHTALSSHLLHQTRLLHSLTYPLLSPLTLPPSEEVIDEILPLLLTLSDSMPRSSPVALASLGSLHSLTADLVQSLSYLSDNLHMSRQTTTTATRRLKSARELVAEMKKEEEEREEGERWLRRGNWSERLGKRECAGVCGDVVGGFEEVCEGWRKRLIAQAEVVSA